MKKLQSLRKHLINRIPDLKKNPERLLTFVEEGAIEFRRGQHLSRQYRFPVRLILTDHSGELDTVIIPLLQWLSHYQPDIDPQEAVRFQAELLHHQPWDLAIEVTLTERVVATVDCELGIINTDHRLPEFPIDSCPVSDWELYLSDPDAPDGYRLIAQWSNSDNG